VACPGPITEACCPEEVCCPKCWGGAEYLLWWIKDGPLPFPLVTTTTEPGSAEPGAIGQPGTRVLFGGNPIDFDSFSGIRATVGGWVDCDCTLGIEASGFLLERRTSVFHAASDGNGNPFLGFPVFEVEAASAIQSAVPVTFPADPTSAIFSRGSILVSSASRLWGAEANGLVNVLRSCNCCLDLLAGFRYLDLQERLTIIGDAVVTDPGTPVVGGGGGPLQVVGAGSAHITGTDDFSTRNQFYGGQIGARLGWRYQGLSVDLLGKVAFGSTHQVVAISGNTVVRDATGTFVGVAPPVSVGSVFTQPTNVGRFTRDEFAVVPEGQVRVGYDVTSSVRAFVGYTFLYWSDVVRPGNQIDRVVNDTQRFGNPLMGPARPLPQFNSTDFWAQGISFGVELHF
jgi:hypothetical protein